MYALVMGALAGCDSIIIPKEEFSSRTSDSCRDCGPGLLSGDDGVITLIGKGDGGRLERALQPSANGRSDASSLSTADGRVREAERRAVEAERRAAAAEARVRELEGLSPSERNGEVAVPPGFQVQLAPELESYFE